MSLIHQIESYSLSFRSFVNKLRSFRTSFRLSNSKKSLNQRPKSSAQSIIHFSSTTLILTGPWKNLVKALLRADRTESTKCKHFSGIWTLTARFITRFLLWRSKYRPNEPKPQTKTMRIPEPQLIITLTSPWSAFSLLKAASTIQILSSSLKRQATPT